MEISSRYTRSSQLHSGGGSSVKQRRSGYEPSDTETEWHETPWREISVMQPRNASPIPLDRRSVLMFDSNVACPPRVSVASPPRRRHSSKSPYKPRRDDGNTNSVSPLPASDNHRNVSPFAKSARRRHVSLYKPRLDEHNMDNNEIVGSNRIQIGRIPDGEEKEAETQLHEISRMSPKSNYSRRAVTNPRLRVREKNQHNNFGNMEQRVGRTPSPVLRNMIQREAAHVKSPSVGEINEIVANAKLSRAPMRDTPDFESIESISRGDIFFSRDFAALGLQKNVLPKISVLDNRYSGTPKLVSEKDSASLQIRTNGSFDHNSKGISPSTGLSQTTTTSSYALSRHNSDMNSTRSSKMSDASGTTSGSLKKFTANRLKSQSDAWFSCMRKGPCRTSKSPEHRPFDESLFIEKAFVVESLRQFWADKHRPGSLNGFTCHKQEAQLLKQLVSNDMCPHILFKGPPGSGKRALTMAFLREIYGDAAWNISHGLRHFQIQDKRSMQVVSPLTSSAHHMELNVSLEPNARYAIMALVKEISNNYAVIPEVSVETFKADYKVIVLYEVDKAAESIQHLIKWIMDCHTDVCKLILCCEDDVDIIDSVKTRCKVINIDAPVTHEIMEVLIQIARKEDFDLSVSFASKIATKSKQNLRKAIMALEACKAHNYPFVDDQPIPLGWEEVLVELAAQILADPSPKRLFIIRGKIQKLLVDFLHPRLILQKLVEEFLKGIESSLKRELYYWHAYYDKRLPTGTSALLKLEEFVAKFMSIYRKSFGTNQYA